MFAIPPIIATMSSACPYASAEMPLCAVVSEYFLIVALTTVFPFQSGSFPLGALHISLLKACYRKRFPQRSCRHRHAPPDGQQCDFAYQDG